MATQSGSLDLQAMKKAHDQALAAAEAIEQFFWHNSQDSGAGEGVGAHITEIPQEDFIADPDNGGKNFLATSEGLFLRDGKTPLARFGAGGAQIGQDQGSSKMLFSTDGIVAYNPDSVPIFNLDMDGGSYSDTASINRVLTYETDDVTSIENWHEVASEELDVSEAQSTFKVKRKNCQFRGLNYISSVTLSDPDHMSYSIEHGSILVTVPNVQFTVGTAGGWSGYLTATDTGNLQYGAKITMSYDGADTLTIKIELRYISFKDSRFSYLLEYTVTTQAPALSFGTDDSTAKGDFSSSFGEGMVTDGSHQSAMGKFNNNDANNLFEVGNGTADNARSNAFEVASSGNIKAGGTVTDGSGHVLSNKSNALLVENKEPSGSGSAQLVTLNANSYGNSSFSVSKTGYTPIGVVGVHISNGTGGSNNTSCPLHSFYISGTTFYWIARNVSSSQAKIKVTADILYVKN